MSETWKVCPSWPTMMASSLGNIRHIGSDRCRSKTPLSNGYFQVGFRHNGRPVNKTHHALVADAFLGPRPDGTEVCHINGDRTDNRPENLRYGTAVENAADRDRHGRNPHGERNGMTKLPDAGARIIRAAYAAGAATQYELAAVMGISQAQVNNIILNKQRRRETDERAQAGH